MTNENKFKEGEIVYERTNPSRKLIVGRYMDNVYYCKIQEAPRRKELVYFERELMATAFSGKTDSNNQTY
jgi:hypothetical protein